jgi:hypothetical protein
MSVDVVCHKPQICAGLAVAPCVPWELDFALLLHSLVIYASFAICCAEILRRYAVSYQSATAEQA